MDRQPQNSASSSDSQQYEIVPIALVDSERIEYQKIAERCGLSLAEWIAEQLRLAAKREAKEA
jgi:hypothetical protein